MVAVEKPGENWSSFRGQFDRQLMCVCVQLFRKNDVIAPNGSVVEWLNGSYVVHHKSLPCKVATPQVLKQPKLEKKKENGL